jgi:hyperosmotically inducible protein
MRIRILSPALLVLAFVALALRRASPCEGAVNFDEAVLNVKVRTALLEKFGTDALGIGVDVNGANVVLSGSVDKQETRDGAKAAASSVKGVGNVENRITLGNGPATRTKEASRKARINWKNSLLEARVKGRLFEQVGENAFKIEVKASGGTVTLTGSVPTENIRATALDTARGTKGVVRLVDRVTVG